MAYSELILNYWDKIGNREWGEFHNFFTASATVEWPNTNELFKDICNFVRINSEYPGDWNIKIEKIIEFDNVVITITYVSSKESNTSFYAVSFFEFEGQKISKLTEYWGENGSAPEWRKTLKLSDQLN